MKSVLEQLDRDLLLVMYLADELSVEDRRRFEKKIAGDGETGTQIESLRQAQDLIEEGLSAADHLLPMPIESRVAERQISRMIQRWNAERVYAPRTESVFRKGLKFPWWTYPLTAAAAVMLAVLVWWGNTPLHSYNSQVAQAPAQVDDSSSVAAPDEPPLADDLERSFRHPSHEGIRAAEGELYALTVGDDSLDDASQQQDVNQ